MVAMIPTRSAMSTRYSITIIDISHDKYYGDGIGITILDSIAM